MAEVSFLGSKIWGILPHSSEKNDNIDTLNDTHKEKLV